MEYNYTERKIVATLASDLSSGVAMNVLGHMSIALGAIPDMDILGKAWHVDSSGERHAGIARYPFIVTRVKRKRLRQLIHEARTVEEVWLIDFPTQMLETGHDNELAESIEKIREEDIEYLGAVVYGSSAAVSNLTGKFTLWRDS